MNKDERNARIIFKAILGLPMTQKERAIYLLFLASDEEMKTFLEREKELNRRKKQW